MGKKARKENRAKRNFSSDCIHHYCKRPRWSTGVECRGCMLSGLRMSSVASKKNLWIPWWKRSVYIPSLQFVDTDEVKRVIKLIEEGRWDD